jgi:hypothetical protein
MIATIAVMMTMLVIGILGKGDDIDYHLIDDIDDDSSQRPRQMS